MAEFITLSGVVGEVSVMHQSGKVIGSPASVFLFIVTQVILREVSESSFVNKDDLSS